MLSALARGDGATIVAIIGAPLTSGDALQLLGDGLRVALHQNVDGAAVRAGWCIDALEQRGWDGDDLLAAQLAAALGHRPTDLQPLEVELDELGDALEGDASQGGGRIDLHTGEVWQQASIDYAREVGDEDEDTADIDEGHWLWFHSEGSRSAYHDMEAFIDTLTDHTLVRQLRSALQARGRFRRFRACLEQASPDEFTRWHQYTDERRRGRSRAWLAGHGYAAAPRHSRSPDQSSHDGPR